MTVYNCIIYFCENGPLKKYIDYRPYKHFFRQILCCFELRSMNALDTLFCDLMAMYVLSLIRDNFSCEINYDLDKIIFCFFIVVFLYFPGKCIKFENE